MGMGDGVGAAVDMASGVGRGLGDWSGKTRVIYYGGSGSSMQGISFDVWCLRNNYKEAGSCQAIHYYDYVTVFLIGSISISSFSPPISLPHYLRPF